MNIFIPFFDYDVPIFEQNGNELLCYKRRRRSICFFYVNNLTEKGVGL